MIQYVPGVDTPERPLDEQADILTKKLVGHQIFARMRGKVVGYPMWNLLDPESDTSPTQSLKEFDEFARGVRVMRNLVVWLRWHGCRRAAEEVVSALGASGNEDYRIWCEEIPFDASVPGVLLMFEPEETLPLAQWWAEERVHRELFHSYMDFTMDQRGQKHTPTRLSADTICYLEKFPNLRFAVSSSAALFCALRTNVVDPILDQTNQAVQEKFNRRNMCFVGPNYPMYTGKVQEVNDRDVYDGGAFAYFFPKKEQAEVLSWFPRALQKRLATWQFRIPERSLRGTVQLHIGFYPESEHKLWHKLYPSLTSKGVAAGFGALLSPRDEFSGEGRFMFKSW